MDAHMHQNSQNQDLARLEQIVSQFLLKSLHIILSSRIPSIGARERDSQLSGPSKVTKSDKWFGLALGERPAALDNLSFWHRNLVDPMVIDVVLVHEDVGSFSADKVETVVERWVIQYECQRMAPLSTRMGESSSAAFKRVYKKTILMLRSLYSTMRLLPSYKLFRKLSSANSDCNFDVIYKVSSFSEPLTLQEMEAMETYSFTPVEAHPGQFCASVMYRPSLSGFNLECSTSLSSQIILDYVGSPATDSHRYFTGLDKAGHAISLPQRVTRPPSSSPFHRPHSWTSGFHKGPAHSRNQTFGGSPPAYRGSPLSHDFPSPSPPGMEMYGPGAHNAFIPARHRRSGSFDDYQLSPPFSTPSPSPPSNFNASAVQSRLRRESAPVAIPLPMVNKTACLSPCSSDLSRQSLPPMSPRSLKLYPSSQESPSRNRSFRKPDASRLPELHTGVTAQHSVQKLARDGKDDSSRFSGLSSSDSPRIGISRSSSRLSFQDDLDEPEFQCPFDLDASDTNFSQGPEGRKTSEYGSRDAAVGALVHMLQSAPPLRQDSTYSTSSLHAANPGEEPGTSSSFFLSRKACDALDELRSYSDLKHLLLSKSGTSRR
uniref:Autophagy-related protein 13 N-terminal domain-containing protein n=1 Tax=Kalanchoe fedtschenkoi TaxID=63787 RepID=A0A7N0REY3_KALFE